MKLDDLFFKLIPLLTGFLILSGIFYAAGYYYVFDFNVFPYLEFSEIIILFAVAEICNFHYTLDI